MANSKSEKIEYTKDKNTDGVPTGSDTMSYNPNEHKKDTTKSAPLHASDPIMERRSDMHGWVRVFPPAADISEWPTLSWRLTTDKTFDSAGIDVSLKAEYIWDCYERPHFVDEKHKFLDLSLDSLL